MSDLIPSNSAEIEQEINDILAETPLTTERGRLFHLINARIGAGGAGGSSLSPVEAIGSYNLADSDVDVPVGGLYIDATKLIFSQVDSSGERLPQTFRFRTAIQDFDFYVEVDLGGSGDVGAFFVESQSLILGTPGNDRGFVSYKAEMPFFPPFPPNSTATLYAMPKTLGAKRPYAPGLDLLFKCSLIGVDSSSVSEFNTNHLMAFDGEGAIDNASTMAFTKVFLKAPQEVFDRIDLFSSAGMYGSSATVSVVFYQNGEFVAAVSGTGSGSPAYDSANRVLSLEFSNRNQSSTVNLDPANGIIEMRVFASFGA